MGQSNARQRLQTIKQNVDELTEKIKSDELTADDRNRSHDILLDYIKEIKFILSKSLRASRIRKVERLIILALQELATLEGSLKTVEPRLKAKSLQTLHDIEKNMKTINAALTNQNFENEKETVSSYRKRISMIGDIDNEVGIKKSKVLDVVNIVESELEVEQQLKKAEEEHYKYKIDLNRFVGVSESNCYKNHRQYLQKLKEEISQISEVTSRITDRKKYLLFNIDNNIAALDAKVKENEETIRKRMLDGEIFTASTPTIPSSPNQIENVVTAYENFEKSFSAKCNLADLHDVCKQLTDLKVKVDQKLKVLENQMQIQHVDPDAELIPVKESTDFAASELPSPPPRIQNKLKKIQNAVEELQKQIATSKYVRDGYAYNSWKKKLEDYRVQLEGLSLKPQHDALYEATSKYIDDVLVILESNCIDRLSVTGDMLIDIMTIGSTVTELGNNLAIAQTREDYDDIEYQLLEMLYYLKEQSIPSTRGNICKFRDYIVIQIESHLSNLAKLKNNLQENRVPTPRTEEIFSY